MAQYKVIQDIEAEDKLLGPLTLKGFIYAIIAVFCAFISFRLIASGLGPLKWLLVLVFLLPTTLFGVLASPLGRHQSTEVWLLARIRFLLKPKRRIWSQSGILHLVSITAPKKISQYRSKGLSETEVKSRLQTLASTLDSRGWAVKNLTIAPSRLQQLAESDRLVAPTTFGQTASDIDIQPADDIMDEQNNPTAKYLAQLMADADAERKTSVASKINSARIAGEAYVEPPSQSAGNPVTPQPNLDASPVRLPSFAQGGMSANRMPQSDYRLLRSSFDYTQDALSEVDRAGFGAGQAAADVMTEANRADKLELVQSGNDFSVATLSALANRKGQFQQLGPNEGVLELH